MLFLRCLLFHALFFVWTAFWAVALLWILVIPRRWMVRIITLYFRSVAFFERTILGLSYRVEGWENLPSEGACLIACKHQSAYETLKLQMIFGDVVIVLKRELMWIPFWGWYQAKAGVIPLNRGAGGAAMRSLFRGAARFVSQGRRIVIFPQGTRVDPGEKHKAYKPGIGLLYEHLNLPIVPVALNSGLFWPRASFLIRPGVVTFKILPAIPAGKSRYEAMAELEQVMEAESDRLLGS